MLLLLFCSHSGCPHLTSPPSLPACRRNGGAGWKPLVLYDTDSSVGLAPARSCYWSDFYQRQTRDPSNVCPAPWVSG